MSSNIMMVSFWLAALFRQTGRYLETFSQCLIELFILRKPGSILATFLLIRLVALDQFHPSGRVHARCVGSQTGRPVSCSLVHQGAPDWSTEVVSQHLAPDM